MTNEQLRNEIINVAKKVGATDVNVVCGSLFCKFNKNIHNVMAENLKTVLQKFFDKKKPNDTLVKMSGALPDYEYAYDFMPVVDFRLNEYGI
mgnify:FL=1|jgi:hypothetical protein